MFPQMIRGPEVVVVDAMNAVVEVDADGGAVDDGEDIDEDEDDSMVVVAAVAAVLLELEGLL